MNKSNTNKIEDLFQEIFKHSTIWIHKKDIYDPIKYIYNDDIKYGYKGISIDNTETMKKLMNRLLDTMDKEMIEKCEKSIEGYLMESGIKHTDNLLVEIENNRIKAFCVFEFFDKNTTINVEYLCSGIKGAGSRLVNILIQYMNINKNVKKIYLTSLPESKGFYKKMGFKGCIDDDNCKMELLRNT